MPNGLTLARRDETESRESPMKRSVVHKLNVRCYLLLLFCLALLSSCGQIPPVGSLNTPPPTPLPIYTRPEQAASVPCPALWKEGETATVRGLYRTSGEEAYLDLVRADSAASSDSTLAPGGSVACWTHLYLRGEPRRAVASWDDPLYVEASGPVHLPSASGFWEMQVKHSTQLTFDPEAIRLACRQAVLDQADDLQSLDWSQLAAPGYVTGTAGFYPQPEAFAQAQVLLLGTDDRKPLLWAVVRGPDLPEVKPLVHRWVEVECAYDLDRAQPMYLTATIRGERLE